MRLEEYLQSLLIDEQDIIKELLRIDNSICHTNISYEQLISSFKSNKHIDDYNLDDEVNVITDGDPLYVYLSLINCGKNIMKININRNFVGINKWLIERTKQYYQDLGEFVNIELDISKSYKDYDDKLIVVIGEDVFVEGISELFSSPKIIKIII